MDVDDVTALFKDVKLKRYYSPDRVCLKPRLLNFFETNQQVLEEEPDKFLNTPLPSSWVGYFTKGFYYDALLCFDKALHYYFAFKTLMTIGYENPGDLVRYYSIFFSTAGFLRLSAWGAVHFYNLDINHIIFKYSQSSDSETQKKLQKIQKLFSSALLVAYSWKKKHIVLQRTRANEHKLVFQEFQKRFEGFNFGAEGELQFFGKRPKNVSPQSDYYDAIERNRLVYDLSWLPGEIMGGAYGHMAKKYSKYNFLDRKFHGEFLDLKKDLSQGTIDSLSSEFRDYGYNEFFTAKYCALLLQLLTKISKNFIHQQSKMIFLDLLKTRRSFLENLVQNKTNTPIMEQKTYFTKMFDSCIKSILNCDAK